MSYSTAFKWTNPDKSYRPNAPKGPFTRTVSAKHPMEVHHVIPLNIANRKYGSQYTTVKNAIFNSGANRIDLVAHGGLPNTTALPYHRRDKDTLEHHRYDTYVDTKITGKDFNGAIAEAANIKATINGMNNTQCLDDIQ